MPASSAARRSAVLPAELARRLAGQKRPFLFETSFPALFQASFPALFQTSGVLFRGAFSCTLFRELVDPFGQQRSHLFQFSRFLKPSQHAGQTRLRRRQPAPLHHLARPLRERPPQARMARPREQRSKTPQHRRKRLHRTLLQRDLRRHNVVHGKVLDPLRVLVQQKVTLARLERRKTSAHSGDDIAHLVRRRPP